MEFQHNNQSQLSGDNDEFTFFCPECNSRITMLKVDIGKIIECDACCEMVKIDYPELRPCPRCQKSIKLQARVCKYCKQQIAPFVDPLTIKPILTLTPPKVKGRFHHKLQAIGVGFIGMGVGFVAGLFGTRFLAKIMHRHITSNADYIVAGILAIYLAIKFYRSKK